MQSLPSVRMTANLNSLLRGEQGLEQAERAIREPDTAHHVVDPDDVLGVDPLAATPLDQALVRLRAIEAEGWFLSLPVPGSLHPLRGPARFNQAALLQGEAVVASTAGVGLVPHRVGAGVQWRVYAADRPFAPSTPYDAERILSEVVIEAAAILSALDVASGRRPADPAPPLLAPGYTSRQQANAVRAARLIAICDAALGGDGGSLSSFEADRRATQLRRLRACAGDALGAAVSWLR
jgi:hypothetical protein